MAKKERSKKGKIALRTGIIEAVLVIATLIVAFATKRVSLTRDMIVAAVLVNFAGIIGTATYKGVEAVVKAITGKKSDRTRTKNLSRSEELVQEMTNIPVVQQTNTNTVVVDEKNNKKTVTKKVSK